MNSGSDINRQFEEESKRLKSTIAELSILNDIAIAISSTQSVEKIIDQVTQRCIKHLNVEEGTVNLLKLEETDLKFQTMIRKKDISQIRLPLRLDNQLTGWMLRNKKPILINDLKNDKEFNKFMFEEIPFENLLCVPMMTKGKLVGFIALFNKKESALFTKDDQRLLSIIAAQSSQVIENARLYEEEKALLNLKEEMRMANIIQQNLLPKSHPRINGYQISVKNISAKEVGGDYYDFMEIEDSNLGFCLGDITGKGMPAAMLMANLQATLRSQTMVQKDCAKCLEITNKLLFKSTESSKFATLFYGLLDPENNIIEYCNGGHDNTILFRKNNEYIALETTGLLLGCFEDSTYQNKQIKMDPGEVLMLYSDGITEAMNKVDEELGLEKLIEIVQNSKENSSETILNNVLKEVKEHSIGVPQSDDVTIMIIKRDF